MHVALIINLFMIINPFTPFSGLSYHIFLLVNAAQVYSHNAEEARRCMEKMFAVP